MKTPEEWIQELGTEEERDVLETYAGNFETCVVASQEEIAEIQRDALKSVVEMLNKLGCCRHDDPIRKEEDDPLWLQYGTVCEHDHGILCEHRFAYLLKAIETGSDYIGLKG